MITHETSRKRPYKSYSARIAKKKQPHHFDNFKNKIVFLLDLIRNLDIMLKEIYNLDKHR